MSITTKKGDNGKTSLCCGKIVSKDDSRVEFCGTLDELCSFLGLSKSLVRKKEDKRLIECIQGDLFVIGAELATGPKSLRRLENRIDKNYVNRLERIISMLEKKKTFRESCFYLPGENTASACFDVARTVTRRAERLAVTLKRKKVLLNEFILIYLNRLSDLLYLLARAQDKNHKKLQRVSIKGENRP